MILYKINITTFIIHCHRFPIYFKLIKIFLISVISYTYTKVLTHELSLTIDNQKIIFLEPPMQFIESSKPAINESMLFMTGGQEHAG